MLVFTIREDFWREWESSFEGLNCHSVKKRFSQFNVSETQLALKKYSEAYSFKIKTSLNKSQLKVLSSPFNLQIFSEAHEYEGNVHIDEIMSETVLNLFFEKKKDDIFKRPIPGFYPNVLMPLCSNISAYISKKCTNEIKYDEVISIIKDDFSSLSEVSELIVKNLISEQIIVKDSLNPRVLRFRHMKFVEYLTSYYIVRKLNKSNDPRELDNLVQILVKDEFLSLYYIHEFIRFICKIEFPELYEVLTNYYSNSSVYMRKLVHNKRLLISSGEKISNLDLDTIEESMSQGEQEICWEGFFVISAKNNKRDKKSILRSFNVAWNANKNRNDRWKLLIKLSQHKLLLEEQVFTAVLSSESQQDWYSFIDGVIAENQFVEFKILLDEYGSSSVFNMLKAKNDCEWDRVNYLVNLIYEGKKYELGA